MKTLYFPLRAASAIIIAMISLVSSPAAMSQENIYEKIVPKFSAREDVDMRYLSTEAYESLAGATLVSAQTRSLANECMGDITSVVILNSNSEQASRIGLSEFESFKQRNPSMRLLMRTRSGHSERSSWFLPAEGKRVPQLIVIVRDAQTLMIAVMTGEKDQDQSNLIKPKNKQPGNIYFYRGKFYHYPGIGEDSEPKTGSASERDYGIEEIETGIDVPMSVYATSEAKKKIMMIVDKGCTSAHTERKTCG